MEVVNTFFSNITREDNLLFKQAYVDSPDVREEYKSVGCVITRIPEPILSLNSLYYSALAQNLPMEYLIDSCGEQDHVFSTVEIFADSVLDTDDDTLMFYKGMWRKPTDEAINHLFERSQDWCNDYGLWISTTFDGVFKPEIRSNVSILKANPLTCNRVGFLYGIE